ncbi:MAG: RNA polymerase subunit sigma, partial [Rhizobiales bacterium 32-66-8]
DAAADDVPQFETVAACLDWLLGQCEPRDRLIVERRFGLGPAESETLEDIGADYGVTRERIRQIEKRALTRMRVRMRRVPLAEHIIAASPTAWLQISDGRGWISDRQADPALRRLDGALQLALELVGTPARTWLSTIATRAETGWIGAPVDPERTQAAAIELGALLKLPLPRSLAEAGGQHGPLHVEAALRIVLGLELDQGYVVQSKPGLRMRRALGLHRLLASASGPMSAEHLIPLYHRLSPSDPCSARDADIVMQAAPHLFVETFDQVWFGIGVCGAPPVLEDPDATVHNGSPIYGEPDPDDDDETCASALIAALERRGPERLLTLYQNAQEILPPGRSPNSVGPTLL